MSKLLVNEYPLIVLPGLAKKIGLNEAIVLQQVHFWLENPNTGVIVDGHKWVHNTYEEWQTNFPFWSVETVKRTIRSLEEANLLISSQTAPNPFDKTKSYRINYDLLDQVNLTPSITETTVSDTNTGDGLSSLPVEWQVAAGVKRITVHDEKEAQMKDSANLIAQGTGALQDAVFLLAYTFMTTRGIIIPLQDAKGNRKVAKAMVNQGVMPNHVESAVRYMIQKNLTCVDLFSVQKIATNEANPAPETYDGAIEGV